MKGRGIIVWMIILGGLYMVVSRPEAPVQKTRLVRDVPSSALPSKPPSLTVVPSKPTPVAQSVYVKGTGVAFRSGPGREHGVVDRFDTGRLVVLLETQGDWSKVHDGLTQREGWIASYLTSASKPKEPSLKKPVVAPAVTAKSTAKKELSDSAIVQAIINESLRGYPGSCPCPYNTDRGGRRCGKRSAYSRPGGYAPVCYPGDVNKTMIAAYRARN